MSDWRARQEGRECVSCGVKRGLFCVYFWRPRKVHTYGRGERAFEQVYPAMTSAAAQCVDRAACEARVAKRDERAKVRGSRIYLTDRPGDPAECEKPGHCCWCGLPMMRVNKAGATVLDRTRGYHRKDRGEPDCRTAASGQYAWGARNAVLAIARLAGEKVLRCADCGLACEPLDDRAPDTLCVCGHVRAEHGPLDAPGTRRAVIHVLCEHGCSACVNGYRAERHYWEADHQVALEDGGEHVAANLRCRCGPCHRAKTARENAARRARDPSDK